MASIFGGVNRALKDISESRERRRTSGLDELTKYAALKEAGYSVPGMEKFGLIQDPNFQSTKELERQKLQGEIENQKYVRDMRKNFGGSPQTFGQPSAAPQSFGNVDHSSPFTFDPVSGKSVKNPAYLDPLKQRKMEAMDEKQRMNAEAEQNKTDMIRQEAESQLSAIREAKRGKDYFGRFGEIPSAVAPETWFNDKKYASRIEWENNVNKLLAGRIIDVMNKMKSASRTGATGFGQLNKSELTLLQDASNVLSKKMPPEVAEKYLNQLEPIYQKMLGGQRSEQRFGETIPAETVPQVTKASGEIPFFNSPEEADASGLPPGSVVMVQGRKYQI